MLHRTEKHLYDIKESIDSIEEYIGDNCDFYEYQRNKLLRRAIERELEIIGEAINRILKSIQLLKLRKPAGLLI